MGGIIVRAIEKVTDKLNVVLKYLCIALLFIMMLEGTVDVLGRYLFNNPLYGTYEIFGVLLPSIVLLGLAYTQAARGHIRITLVLNRLPAMAQRVLGIFTTIIMMFITFLMGWHGLLLAIRFFEMGKEIDTIRVPIWIPQLVLPLGALVLFFVLLVQLIEYLTKPAELIEHLTKPAEEKI
jgi:TRAP-type C4-dicarboxylate transport system permease small subunit